MGKEENAGKHHFLPFLQFFKPNQIQISSLNFNSLPNDDILDWSKLKALADKINVTEKMKHVLGRIENVKKGENAGDQHFLLFLQSLQKASFPRSLKVEIVW